MPSQTREGRVGEAARIREKLKPIKLEYELAYKRNQNKTAGVDDSSGGKTDEATDDVDFFNPTEAMIEEAMKVGLDLKDKRVRKVMGEVMRDKVDSEVDFKELLTKCVDKGELFHPRF